MYLHVYEHIYFCYIIIIYIYINLVCCLVLSCLVLPCFMLQHKILQNIKLYFVMICYTIRYCIELYSVLLLYYVILYHVILLCVIWCGYTLYCDIQLWNTIYIIRIFYTTSITSIVYCVGFYYIEKKTQTNSISLNFLALYYAKCYGSILFLISFHYFMLYIAFHYNLLSLTNMFCRPAPC